MKMKKVPQDSRPPNNDDNQAPPKCPAVAKEFQVEQAPAEWDQDREMALI